VPALFLSLVQGLLGLPEEHAEREEEEEAGEEDGEEDKQINVGLVLPEEQQALRVCRTIGTRPAWVAHTQQQQVEAARLEGMVLVWVGDDQPVSHTADHQHC
jgi:hypothetical protein